VNFKKPQFLPRHTDDEVEVFHPILGYCLSEAIKNLGLSKKLEIEHHKDIGSLTADFAVINLSSNRILLPLEVKRTPASISSTRYRNQARMYITEGGKLCETPFYVLSNLEITELYRHDAKRSSVIEQIVEPGAIKAGSFSSTSIDDFLQQLTKVLEGILNTVLTNKYSYKEQIKNFASLLDLRKDRKWHETLVPSCFEYIRGAFKNMESPAQEWRVATFFNPNPQRLLELGEGFDFKNIFKDPKPSPSDADIWDTDLIKELYNAGSVKKSGDDFAELVHFIVSKGREAEGLVTTDTELARFLVALTKILLGRELNDDEIVCDPAAGIGSLLTSLIDFYLKLKPSQVWANDKERLFEEILSLRLGLLFPTLLSRDNSPTITTNCISELKKGQFKNVKIIVMNPPFISSARGVDVNKEKRAFSKCIKDITGQDSSLNIGQIGLEGPFLELVTTLAEKGTLVAVIIPKRYLTAQGDEAIAIRKFLIGPFGLKILATYPRTGLFEEVIKGTMIAVGVKGEVANSIRGISSDVSIEHIDLQEFVNKLSENGEKDDFEPVHGVLQRVLDREELAKSLQKGWRSFFGVGRLAQNWVEHHFKGFLTLKDAGVVIKRGRLGNKGLSDLLYISSNEKLWKACQSRIPPEWLGVGIKNSDQTRHPFLKEDKDFYYFLKAPRNVLDEKSKENKMLIEIIDQHSKLGNTEGEKQKKKEKEPKEAIKILLESSGFASREGTILIPRNIRRIASGFILDREAYISTNFIEVYSPNNEYSLLLLSWVLSIFGQLQFELMSQDQEGARKIEKEQAGDFMVPDLLKIPEDFKAEIIKEMGRITFLDLYNIQLRSIDLLWSRILFGDDGLEKLNQVKGLIEEFILERDPQ
jgi:hypothetical protein